MNDLSPEVFTALSVTLLASLWQGAIIGIAAVVSFHLTRRSKPHLRYLLGCIALACCVVLPMLTFISALMVDSEGARGPWVLGTAGGLIPSPSQIRVGDWMPYLVWGWFAGCSLLLARTAIAVAWLGQVVRKPQTACQRVWQLRVDSLAARMVPRRSVRLLMTDDISSPAVVGIVRPVVFLPFAVAMRMPVEWVEALLAHELAHIRRHDYLFNLAQKVIEAVLFYHPVVWWLSSRIRQERELIADSIAVEAGIDRRTLALALAELTELQDANASSLLPNIALPAGGGRLMFRIQSLIQPTKPVAIGHSKLSSIVLIAVAVIVIAGYSSEFPFGHAARRAEPAMAIRPARVSVSPMSAAQVVPILGAANAKETAQATRVEVAPQQTRPTHARQEEALEPQPRLAPLERLNRRMGDMSMPMEALETTMTELHPYQVMLADSDTL